jgi:Leucine-rich repeat (LRR) protein
MDNGLLIDCKIDAMFELKDVLTLLISQSIKSLSIYSNNLSLNSLPERLFQNFSTIEQMYISVPSLVNVSEELFRGLESSLKTLSIVNSKMNAIPVQAISILKRVSSLDLGSNDIQDVGANAFDGLPLVSLNLQSNQINSLHELSFGGLEKTLVELILIGNSLDTFPLPALKRLQTIESLKLQSNQISHIPDDGFTRFTSLKILDLHSNRIDRLDSRSFTTTPLLASLSIANNRLTANLTDPSIFEHLLDLETLDMSHNKLKVVELNHLNALRTLDLSYNQLESFRFHNMPKLEEIFVSNNNILKLTNQTFFNSTSISVIFLQNNSIEAIDYNTFHSLNHLLTLDLSSNRLKAIDPQLLKHSIGLQSLYLDSNMISTSSHQLVRLSALFYTIYHIFITSAHNSSFI